MPSRPPTGRDGVERAEPAPPRRTPARATRERLLAAGRAAFAQKGLAGTNLRDDILEPAGISVGSFYHQFHDKTDLLLAILREHSERFRERLDAAHAPTPGRSAEQIARDSWSVLFESADQDEDVLRIQLRESDSNDPAVRRFLRDDRERWLASLADDYRRIWAMGGDEKSLDADLAAKLIGGLSLGAVGQYLEAPPEARRALREQLVDGLVRFTLGGLPALARPADRAPSAPGAAVRPRATRPRPATRRRSPR